MSSFRHLSRQLALQSLFYYHFNEEDREITPEESFEYVIDEFGKEVPEIEWAQALFEGIVIKTEELNETIQKYAPDWPIDKIARLDLHILQMGVYELLECKDIPPLVAINEAVELSKEFGDLNSSKFINGVLSAVAHDKIGKENLNTPKK